MNDRKLAEEIERAMELRRGNFVELAPRCVEEIIAALRRSPNLQAMILRCRNCGSTNVEDAERPPSGEMVMALQEIKDGPRKAWVGDAFIEVESETYFNWRMMQKLRAMLSAAEAEGVPPKEK
jgi:hypothetical protein